MSCRLQIDCGADVEVVVEAAVQALRERLAPNKSISLKLTKR